MATAALLAVTTVVLGGLLIQADADRRDQQRRAGDLTDRNAAAVEELAVLRTQLTAEQARFKAVEPCLRQLVSPPPAKALTEAEKRRILEEAKRHLPPVGSTNGTVVFDSGSVLDYKALLPACKDIEKNLR